MKKIVKYIALIHIFALNIANALPDIKITNNTDKPVHVTEEMLKEAKFGFIDTEKLIAEVMKREKHQKALREIEELRKKYTIELEEKTKHVMKHAMRELLLNRIREYQSIYQ